MARRDDHEEAVNADSFLDIVASVVSVLIIMVMMTGLRIKHSPPDAPLSAASAQIADDLKRQLNSERTLKNDVMKIAHSMEETQREAERRQRKRDALALAVANLQPSTISSAPQQTTPLGREIQNKIIAAQTRLDMLRQQTQAVENAPPTVEKIDNFPAPISHTVDGRELHFQLHHGRLAHVPLDEQIEVAMADATSRRGALLDRGELSNTVPPQEGFRTTYTIELRELTADEARESGRHGRQLAVRIAMEATSDDLGEPIDIALGPQSQFRSVLADRRAREATITIWFYPDSFDAFRKVKKELYRLGFPVAARPLCEGVPIGASTEGSKSTAQ